MMLFRQLPATDDASQLNQPIHSPPQATQLLPLFVMYKKHFSHPDQFKTASPGHGCSPPRPVPPSNLYPCHTSRAARYRMLASTSGQQQAEPEPVPSTRAAATLKHPKPPLLATTSIRCGPVFSCKRSCKVRAGQCGRNPW